MNNNPLNPQSIQAFFWKLKLKQYIEALEELTGKSYKDIYEKLLPYTALNSRFYDFGGLEEDPPEENGDITLGEFITAANYMVRLNRYVNTVDIEMHDDIINTGRMIIEELMIFPLSEIGRLNENEL